MDISLFPIRSRPIACMLIASGLALTPFASHADVQTRGKNSGAQSSLSTSSTEKNESNSGIDFGSLIPLFSSTEAGGNNQQRRPLVVPTADGGQQNLYFNGIIPLFSGEDGKGQGVALFTNEEGQYFGGVIPIFKPINSASASPQGSSSRASASRSGGSNATTPSRNTGGTSRPGASAAPRNQSSSDTATATNMSDSTPSDSASAGNAGGMNQRLNGSAASTDDLNPSGTAASDEDVETDQGASSNTADDQDQANGSGENDAYYDQIASVFSPSGNQQASSSGQAAQQDTTDEPEQVDDDSTAADSGEGTSESPGNSQSSSSSRASSSGGAANNGRAGASRSNSALSSATNTARTNQTANNTTTRNGSVDGTSGRASEDRDGGPSSALPSATGSQTASSGSSRSGNNASSSRNGSAGSATGTLASSSRNTAGSRSSSSPNTGSSSARADTSGQAATAPGSSNGVTNSVNDRFARLQETIQQGMDRADAEMDSEDHSWNHAIRVPQGSQRTSTITSNGSPKPHASLCISAQDIIDYQERSDGYINGVNKEWTWSHAAWASSAKPGYDNQPDWVRSQFTWLRDVPMNLWTQMMPWYVVGTVDGDNGGGAVEIGNMSVQYYSVSQKRWITLGTDMKASGGTFAAGASGSGKPSTTTSKEVHIPPSQFAHGWFDFVEMPEPDEIKAVSVAVQVRSISGKNLLVETGADYYPSDWRQRLGEGPLMPGLGTSAPRLVGPEWTTVVFTTLSNQTADGTGVSPAEVAAQRPHCG